MRILLTSSKGGHLTELLKLQHMTTHHDVNYVIEHSQQMVDLKHPVYYLSAGTHFNNKLSYLKILTTNIAKGLYYVIKLKPQVIISTGAHNTIPLCLFGKLLGKRIIYIESIARVHTPSKTGRLMYKIADQFYVQWPEMLAVYPKAIYKGQLL